MTSHSPKIEVLSGPERRRRWSTADKLALEPDSSSNRLSNAAYLEATYTPGTSAGWAGLRGHLGLDDHNAIRQPSNRNLILSGFYGQLQIFDGGEEG